MFTTDDLARLRELHAAVGDGYDEALDYLSASVDALQELIRVYAAVLGSPEVIVGETGMVFAGQYSYGQAIRLVPLGAGKGES